jgi:hypothetical protein
MPRRERTIPVGRLSGRYFVRPVRLIVMSIQAMDKYYHHVGHTMLLQSTKALAKFVREHDGIQLPFLNEITAFLEAGDFQMAYKRFNAAHFGAHGFNDWFPPIIFEHEDADYVQVVFESLTERWARLMRAAGGEST